MKRLAALILLALPTLSFAQSTEDAAATDGTEEVDADSGRRILRQKVTEVDFDGLDVNATLVKPTGVLVSERRRESFNSLIALRANFDSEMDASVDDMK
jgi:hypothetical protein